jgi:VanZ family protein
MNPKNLVALIYVAGLLLGSVIPGDDPLSGYNFTLYLNPTLQNLLHVPAFAGLSFLMMRSRFGEGWGTWKRNAVVFLACASFGVVCELIQIWVPGRFAGAGDAVFNMVGAMAGQCVYVFVAHSS